MKIQICSDLHLEFGSNRAWFKKNPLIPQAEILVIAGDTYYLDRDFGKLDFIKRVADEFEQVYLIPGNHEYYGGFDVSTALAPTCQKILENVYMLNNEAIEIKGVSLIFSTMWSLIQHNIMGVVRGMMDFERIRFEAGPLTVNHFNKLHEVAFEFIEKEVQKEGKKVVISHHLPSNACNIEAFKGSVLNEAFCVEKSNFILDHEIDCWIYGHSHRNLKDFYLGDTLMVCNQFGYISMDEHRSFDYQKVIDIG